MMEKPSLTPLLRRTGFKDGESLSSLLVRLEDLNFYDRSSYLRQICLRGVHIQKNSRYSIEHPTESEIYTRLSVLTQISPFKLYRATFHRFAEVLTSPDTHPSIIKLQSGEDVFLTKPEHRVQHLRTDRQAAWCPFCIEEAAYHRVIWIPVAVATCLRHACLLCTECPSCTEPVSIRAIVQTRCDSCGADLKTAVATPISPADAIGQQTQEVIQGWLHGLLITDPLLNLPNVAPNALYRALDGLRWSLASVSVDSPYLHPTLQHHMQATADDRQYTKLTPTYSYSLYATAFQGLLNWPNGFHAFLWACLQRSEFTSSKSVLTNLGTIYCNWLEKKWQHPAFEFIQDAFNQFLVDHFAGTPSIVQSSRYQQNSAIAKRFPCVTVAEAARMLHVGDSTIKELIANGHLVTVTDGQESSNPFRLVRRAEVLALRQQWSEEISLEETARLLGLSNTVSLDLVRGGLLEAKRGPIVDASSQWRFHRLSVNACLERIKCQIERVPPQGQKLIDLATAARKLAIIGLNAAQILGFVAEGRIKGYWLTIDNTQLGNIRFSEQSIRFLLRSLKQERGWMSFKEVVSQLSLTYDTVLRLEKAGWIVPIIKIGQLRYFIRADVELFAANYIRSHEAASLLGISPLTIQTWARQGRLTPISGPHVDGGYTYLFDKEALLVWSYNRLTFGEAMKLLGVSKATLHRWVEQGKLTRLEGMGGKQRWFDRKDVEQLVRREP